MRSYDEGYPATVNHSPESVEAVRAACRLALGPEALVVSDVTMGAEDFSRCARALPTPGCRAPPPPPWAPCPAYPRAGVPALGNPYPVL